MRRHFLTWSLMALMASAGVCTSCNDSEDAEIVEETSQNEATLKQFTRTLAEVQQEMQSVDFGPLNQLISDLNAKGTRFTTRATDLETDQVLSDTNDPEFIKKLVELLQGLFVQNEMNSSTKQYYIVNSKGTFSALLELYKNQMSGEGSDSREKRIKVNVTANPNETTQYDIYFCRDIVTTTIETDRDITLEGACRYIQLEIAKNDEVLMKIVYIYLWQDEVDGITNIFHTCNITYMEHAVEMKNVHTDLHDVMELNLKYSKGGSELVAAKINVVDDNVARPYSFIKGAVDYEINIQKGIIGLNGHINSIPLLVADIASIGLIYKNGAKEEVCSKVAENFNSNMTSHVTFSGMSLGDLLIGYRPKQETGRYHPVLTIKTSLFGPDTAMTFDEILAILGITWEELKELIGI